MGIDNAMGLDGFSSNLLKIIKISMPMICTTLLTKQPNNAFSLNTPTSDSNSKNVNPHSSQPFHLPITNPHSNNTDPHLRPPTRNSWTSPTPIILKKSIKMPKNLLSIGYKNKNGKHGPCLSKIPYH
jgi:hypothetical protein